MLHDQGSMVMTDRLAGNVVSRVYGTCGHSVSFSYAGFRILVSPLAFNVVFALLIALRGKMFRNRHEHSRRWRWAIIFCAHINVPGFLPVPVL